MLTPEQLQELYDKQCLHDNLMRYCRGVDRMHAETIRSTYWPESTDDHGGYIGPGQAWADAAVVWKDRNHTVNHHVSNVLSEIDGHRAKRESMFICVVQFKEPAITMFQAGRYRDLCEKRGSEWRVLNRVCIWDWCEQRVMQPGWRLVNVPNASNWGAFAPEDPIYKDWSVSSPTTYRGPSPY
jgi:hypothetical protein